MIKKTEQKIRKERGKRMGIPGWIIWVFIISIFIYTAGYSITLWRENSKLGSITIFILAIAIVIMPFFSVFKN